VPESHTGQYLKRVLTSTKEEKGVRATFPRKAIKAANG